MPTKVNETWRSFKYIFLNVLAVFPAAVFWASVLIYAGFGTDYLFDNFFDRMGSTWWGNLILILLVIGVPGAVIAYNGMEMMKKRTGYNVTFLAIATGFLLLGFLAVLRKS